jgi:acetyl-CoA synthetase
LRGAKRIPLKQNVDEALIDCPNIHTVFVVNRTGAEVNWVNDRDVSYQEMVSSMSPDCAPEMMDSEDPLFILYTSGSTGKPKGVLHTTAGYLLQTTMSHKLIFDYHEGEIFWCTADVGWVTGHSYIVYGPLSNGATTLMFEGIPTYPSPSRFWEVVDKHQVNIFYTAPTALRALMAQGKLVFPQTSRKSIRVLGTVGEPINPEAWEWYFQAVGDKRCPIVDTWWQTETGAAMISPFAGSTPQKPGSATKPFFGIEPALLDENGKEVLLGANLHKNEYGNMLFADYFFFITGFHGFHVFSGVILLIILLINVFKGTYERRGDYEMVEKIGLYWHFVDLVWVFVFTFFYLV